MKKIVLTGGGTGGHIYPHLAILNELKKNFTPVYIGSYNGMEKDIMSKIMPYFSVSTAKLKRKLTLQNILIPFLLLKGFFQARKILKKERPSIIFSKGGFVAVPVVLAGRSLKIPTITHESDITLGLANKLMKNLCQVVCTTFETTATSLKNGVWTGSPVREEIFKGNAKNIFEKYKINSLKPTITIFGGSLGSLTINKAIWKNVNALTNKYNILHIVGKNNLNSEININNYIQVEYASNIQDFFSASDMVITRGGSNAIWELFAIKKPMLIIPLKKGESRGDQILNAQYFKKMGYATVLYEENLNTLSLNNSIEQTLKNKQKLVQTMNKKFVNGTQKIIEQILKYSK